MKMETVQRRRSKIASSIGDSVVPKKPAFRKGSKCTQKLKKCPELASDSSSWSSDTRDNESWSNELGWGSLKQAYGTPVKKLLAEEMSREIESKRRSPSLIARLMGLDGLPPQQPSRKQHKKSADNSHQSTASLERGRRGGASSSRRSFRKSSKEEPEFKDVFEVLDASRMESGCNSSQRTTNTKLTEADMVFIGQKFMDAKRLSIDERLQDSREFHDALEVLDSNNDLLLKFLHQPDLLFTKHLHDLGASPQSRCGHISAKKLSHAPEYENSGLGWKTERGTPRKNNFKSSLKHHDSHSGRHVAQTITNAANFQFLGEDAAAAMPTRIVVLKPNLGKVQTATRTVSTPSSSHVYLPECRKHMELPGIKNREAEMWMNKGTSDDVESSRQKSRESREIAKEITRQMKNSLGNGAMNVWSSGFKGYAGDESSSNLSGSESANELDVRMVTSRDGSDRHYKLKSSSSRTESPVSREAKKRLSRRWRMSHKSQDLGEISRSSTLGEMLAIHDRNATPAYFDVSTGDGALGNRFGNKDRPAGWVEPLGISSRDGWRDGSIRKLSRSRSLPSSSSFGSSKTSIRRETHCDERYLMPNETVKQETIKVVKGNSHKREDSSYKSSKLNSKRSPSSDTMSRECNDTSPHICLPQGESKIKQDDQSEQMHGVSETFASTATATNSVAEDLLEGEHMNRSISSESPNPQSDLSASGGLCTGDVDVLSSKEPSGPLNNSPLHHSLPELESPASSKEADQPSPVSILEAPFVDDSSCGSECFGSLSADIHGLRMQLQLLKLESDVYTEGPMLVSSDEETEETSVGFTEEKSIIIKSNDNWESSYLTDVLIESGFNDVNLDMFITTCHSLDCPVSPSLFEDLEKKYANITSYSRSERRLLFESINMELMDIHQKLLNPHPWVKPVIRVKRKWENSGLKDYIQKSLTSRNKNTGNGDSAEEVLAKESEWLDIGDEIDVIGRDMERLLVDELVAEIVIM